MPMSIEFSPLHYQSLDIYIAGRHYDMHCIFVLYYTTPQVLPDIASLEIECIPEPTYERLGDAYIMDVVCEPETATEMD